MPDLEGVNGTLSFTDKELQAFNAVFQKTGASNPIAGLQDVFWALLNSNEFIMNH